MQSTISWFYQRGLFFFRFLSPPFADPTYINGKQDVLKQPEANKDFFSLLYFRLWVIIKALLKQISVYLLSHSHISIIVLTCPDNINVLLQVSKKSSAEIMHAFKITQITMLRGQYYFKWNLHCGVLQLAKTGPPVTKNFPLVRLFLPDVLMAWRFYTPYVIFFYIYMELKTTRAVITVGMTTLYFTLS